MAVGVNCGNNGVRMVMALETCVPPSETTTESCAPKYRRWEL